MEALYQKCPVSKGEIRVLTVRTAPRSSPAQHSLRGHFQILRFGEQVPVYTAISYSWGHATPARTTAADQKMEVQFPGGDVETESRSVSLPLSQTLTDLFHSLLRGHASATVWVDAICINQHDKIEKGFQVDQMGDVYSRADQVLVWLGTSTPASAAAFRFMQSKRNIP